MCSSDLEDDQSHVLGSPLQHWNGRGNHHGADCAAKNDESRGDLSDILELLSAINDAKY